MEMSLDKSKKSKGTKKWIAPIVAGSLLMNAGIPFAHAYNHPLTESKEKTQEVIVFYKNQQGKKDVLNRSNEIEYVFQNVPAVSVEMEGSDVAKLKKDSDIAYIEPNIEFRLMDQEVKPIRINVASSYNRGSSSEESQWNIQSTNVAQAWKKGLTGKGVKIAVVDTGVSPQLDLNVSGGVSTVDYTSSYLDDNGHGTHVAGIIGAERNGKGIAGVAPDAEIYAVKAMGKDGSGNLQDILEGIDWAISRNVDIINLSIGTTVESQALHDLIKKAYQKGILVVASSGNTGTYDGAGNTVTYPAKWDEVIAVSAVDKNLNRANFSATGEQIEFSAPGVDIISTYKNGGYAISSGTSQAAPHVSGMLALLKQKNPSMKKEDLRKELIKYTKDLGQKGKDSWYGYGFVQYIESQEKTNSSTNLSQLSASVKAKLSQAETYLSLAKKYKKEIYLQEAKKVLDSLPDYPEKSTLLEQWNSIFNEIQGTKTNPSSLALGNNTNAKESEKSVVSKAQLEKAEMYLRLAEKYRHKYYMQKAEELIRNLPDSPEKEALKKRLDAIMQ